MRCEHHIVLLVSEVEVTDLESWDQSQLRSNYTYPLREVCSDQRVFELTWDTVMVNHASQRWDVVWQDRWDLLRVSQIIAVFASFLSSVARTSSSRWGCLQSTSRRCLYSYRHDFLSHEVYKNLLHGLLYCAMLARHSHLYSRSFG
jgi:hypothetical protein